MTETELSPRQRLVMQCLVDGLSFKMIADKLGMQSGTAKKHAMRAREKVGAKSLYQCIAILVARGVIVPAAITVDQESLTRCPSCAGEKQVIGEDGTVWVCGICGGTGERR